MKKRVLISVSDKTGITKFAKFLVNNNYEIISTGGTKKILEKEGIEVVSIDKITGFPEMLDGRVKTLHPKVHAGLLGLRNNPNHLKQMEEQSIDFIDMVIVNLYPFINAISDPNVTLATAIENIDIGGPSMLRSAAKNYESVTVVCDIDDYEQVMSEITEHGSTTKKTRENLAAKVFQTTAYYDSYIANYLNKFSNNVMPNKIVIPFQKKETMRYGENPHQQAAFYINEKTGLSLSQAKQLQGKTLSYNNIQDANAAIQIMAEFNNPVVVGLKHMNPCGVGTGKTVDEAWSNCYSGDSVSIFGGIISTNQVINKSTAEKMSKIFLEIIIAPSFSEEALKIFSKKKNLRILTMPLSKEKRSKWQYTSVNGGLLVQQCDLKNANEYKHETVTKNKPNDKVLQDMIMGQNIVKHVKSNAIVIVKNQQLIGVGAGQMNRIGAAKIALEWCKDKTNGAILASDAFLPFDDVVKLAGSYKITGVIQPGGSIRDAESISAADELGMSMVFTKIRHFKH